MTLYDTMSLDVHCGVAHHGRFSRDDATVFCMDNVSGLMPFATFDIAWQGWGHDPTSLYYDMASNRTEASIRIGTADNTILSSCW